MTAPTVRVTLRYRPAADVLTGHLHLGLADDGASTTVDTPDADTTLVWAHVAGGEASTGAYLSEFQIVFAAARFEEGWVPLPPPLRRAAAVLVHRAAHVLAGVTDPLARLHASAEATATVSLADLTGGGPTAPPAHRQAIDRRTVTRLSHSLSRVADAVEQRVPVDDEVEVLHTDHLAQLLRELSTTIQHQQPRTAPGTSAAARAAAIDTLSLSDDELDVLEQALDDLDDLTAWTQADRALVRLLTQMEHAAP